MNVCESKSLFLLQVFHLLIGVLDLAVHLVHFVQQRIEGVFLVVNLRLETETEAL